jgi:hypothetical protein
MEQTKSCPIWMNQGNFRCRSLGIFGNHRWYPSKSRQLSGDSDSSSAERGLSHPETLSAALLHHREEQSCGGRRRRYCVAGNE